MENYSSSGFKRDETKDRKDTEERESRENGTASLRGKNDELRKLNRKRKNNSRYILEVELTGPGE